MMKAITNPRAAAIAAGLIKPAPPGGDPTPEIQRPGVACLRLDGLAQREIRRPTPPPAWMLRREVDRW